MKHNKHTAIALVLRTCIPNDGFVCAFSAAFTGKNGCFNLRMVTLVAYKLERQW